MIRHSRLTALGIVLCVLAALFAVEAKIAWFSPAGSAAAQMSYDKAAPVEPPKALQHGFNAALHWPHFSETANLFAAVLVLAASATVVVRPAPFLSRVSASPGFTAALFFRPPPIL